MAVVEISHSVTLYPQPTDVSCWSAVTTMLHGSLFCAGPGTAKLQPSGGLIPDGDNIYEFARAHHLHVHPMASWGMGEIIRLLEFGPIGMLGAMPRLHAVLIAGALGDGTAAGTELTIYDPWPPHVGSIIKVSYDTLMRQFPLATMHLLQKHRA